MIPHLSFVNVNRTRRPKVDIGLTVDKSMFVLLGNFPFQNIFCANM